MIIAVCAEYWRIGVRRLVLARKERYAVCWNRRDVVSARLAVED